MSTLLQIKRSSANAAPASLLEGELAYSFVSNTLFIGSPANTAINIGGQYYTNKIDLASSSNGASTLVLRAANGSAEFSQLTIFVSPTANNHVATKEYVDTALNANITLASLNDVNIGAAFSNQSGKILVGNTAGYYVGRTVTGNISVSETGVFTVGDNQITNSMLRNSGLIVLAGNGLIGGGTVALGGSTILHVNAGSGIANTNDRVSVDSTVLRTDATQTVNGLTTFANTVTFNNGISVTGNIILSGNTTYINVTTLNVSDPLIYLAANNNISDTVDIGFMGGKNTSGVYSHTGLIRHATDGKWYLFDGLTDEGHIGNVVDIANTTYALLRANLEAKQLTVTGANSYANISSLTLVTPLAANSGGTGRSSFTANGVVFANTANSLSFATGSEDQVLSIISGVPAFKTLTANLTVKEIFTSNSYVVNSFSGISTLQFDSDSGLAVVDEGNNTVTIQLNSTFKFWEVNGVPGLTAFGLDTVNFITGYGIEITANNANTPKSITFSAPLIETVYNAANNRVLKTGDTMTGDLNIEGALNATTKSFVINHPSKPGKKLRYGSLEGPENGIYVRGVIKDYDVIHLPDYWVELVDSNTITAILTPVKKYQKLYIKEIKDNKVYIGNSSLFGEIYCNYVVYGERKDVEKLRVEY